jgi:transitional endoplasmic reticulum ATPase
MHDNGSNSDGSKPKDAVAVEYLHNAQAPRINTDITVLMALEREYPDKRITVIPEYSCNLLSFAASGHAIAIPDNDSSATNAGSLAWQIYIAPGSRLNGGTGAIANNVLFGKYKYQWGDYEYILYLIEGRDGTSSYPLVRNNYLVSSTGNSANALMLAAGYYNTSLHGEIWVFDQGYWQKDAGLWESIQSSSWDNVILDEGMKKAMISDVNRFYDGRDTYKRLKVPWKRGIIYYGPPGNGKTISIKATMKMLYDRKDPVPTLYVKTLTS